jgi:hypothetical protein
MPFNPDTDERSDNDISEYGSKATSWAMRNGRHPREYEDHMAAVERVRAEQTPEPDRCDTCGATLPTNECHDCRFDGLKEE